MASRNQRDSNRGGGHYPRMSNRSQAEINQIMAKNVNLEAEIVQIVGDQLIMLLVDKFFTTDSYPVPIKTILRLRVTKELKDKYTKHQLPVGTKVVIDATKSLIYANEGSLRLPGDTLDEPKVVDEKKVAKSSGRNGQSDRKKHRSPPPAPGTVQLNSHEKKGRVLQNRSAKVTQVEPSGFDFLVEGDNLLIKVEADAEVMMQMPCQPSKSCSVAEVIKHVSVDDYVKVDVKSNKEGVWSLIKITLPKSKVTVTHDLINLEPTTVAPPVEEDLPAKALEPEQMRKETTDLLTNLEKMSTSVPSNILEVEPAIIDKCEMPKAVAKEEVKVLPSPPKMVQLEHNRSREYEMANLEESPPRTPLQPDHDITKINCARSPLPPLAEVCEEESVLDEIITLSESLLPDPEAPNEQGDTLDENGNNAKTNVVAEATQLATEVAEVTRISPPASKVVEVLFMNESSDEPDVKKITFSAGELQEYTDKVIAFTMDTIGNDAFFRKTIAKRFVNEKFNQIFL